MLIVQKFGGSSVADSQRLNNVAQRVIDTYNEGNEVVVVVSAQGDTTDDLIAKAKEINTNPSKRELDMLMTAGEQISASLLAMTIQNKGIPAVSLLGWQIGLKTNAAHTQARIRSIDSERIREELSRNNIVVIAGFQGIDKHDDITTLGRGGSDTTAVAIAASLKADLCQIFTDVDGVYTADPRKVKTAQKMEEITFDEMLELATLGAQVLNNRSVELAKKYSVKLEVLSSLVRLPGTKVKEDTKVEKLLVRGVAKDGDAARISIVGIKDTPGMAFKVFSAMAAGKINVDIILQSVGRDGTKDIAFTVNQEQGKDALDIIETLKDDIMYSDVIYDDTVAKVSVVGAGMESHPGVAAKMFEVLYSNGINIQMISTSEIKISVLIDQKDADRAVEAVHDAFFA